MRIPRSIQLSPDSGSVHKFWRCHNRAFLLKKQLVKDLYLECTEYALKHNSVKGKVLLSSFCIMNNHTHMHLNYDQSSDTLSQFMRIAHSRFGFTYNKLHNTSGKVANERPKTPLIEDPIHSMRVHFYIEANPIRSGVIKFEKLHLCPYSSFGFYAYGIRSKWSHLLTIPKWYLELGKSPRERQAKYRKLFKEYLKIKENPQAMFRNFIGSYIWIDTMTGKVKVIVQKRTHPPP